VQIRVLAVGKLKEQYLVEGIEEYSKRLGRYERLEIVELRAESFSEPLSAKEVEEILRREGDDVQHCCL